MTPIQSSDENSTLVVRQLERHELSQVWSIDRAEIIESVYALRDGALVRKPEYHDVRGWPDGEPEHYGPLLLDCFDLGGTAYGAFERQAMVGAAVLESRFIGTLQDQLQLKFLHVSQSVRGTGLGRTLLEKCVERARELGAQQLYVSATPSENTIDFYLRRGCRVAEEVDPELFELEPKDIHLMLELAAFDLDPDPA